LKGQQGFYELGSFGALNASINRQFLKQKLTVTASAIDIFKTNKNEFEINQGSIHATGLRQGDTQRFGLNLRYNFGIRKKEEANNIFNIDSPEKGN
jgi:iron complex outermembrane recepter protein